MAYAPTSEKDFKPHVMYDAKSGEEKMAKTYKDHLRLSDLGWSHEKSEDGPKDVDAMMKRMKDEARKSDQAAKKRSERR